MQCSLLFLTTLSALALGSEVNPVQKVIQLLEGMKDKGMKEMQEEQAQYAKYERFCEDTLIDKQRSIKEATEKIEILEAEIQKSTSEAERLTSEIAEHTADIESTKAEQDKATSVRKEERADFEATLTDYTESIDAIGRAIKALKDNNKKLSFVQLLTVRNLKKLPSDAFQSIDAYLAGSDDATDAPALIMEASRQPPAPKVYESQSGGVISMLESLQDKFVDERASLEKEEAQKKHAYELLVQGLKTQETQAKKDQKQKAAFKAKELESKAANEGELEETTSEKASDTKYREDLKATCQKKATDMASRTKLRKEELEAIAKATEIIAGKVASSAEKHLPSLLQTGSRSAALAFLRSESPAREQVARFLQQGASSLGSRVLAAAAVRVRADPIAKVKEMIQNLITKLNEQNDKAAEKKAECDLQLTENKATREDKTDQVDTLKSEIDQLSATITKLGEETVTLTKEIDELNAAMKSATELRLKEKEKNTAAIKDAKEAQAAVASALSVLSEFYEKAGEATALVQQSASSLADQPEIFDESYNGMGGESGGVIGMLQVIESDFARLEAETTAEEAKAVKEFNDFMEDSKVDKASKATAVEHKSRKKQTKSQDLTTSKADLLCTEKELDAAMDTFKKLSASCLDTGASFAERQAQRAQEIKDLQEALEMLQSQNR
eukprot:TRINITY_DN1509_c0_g2_i1.p1 TRINITY_DN1509_c0_g2~~TRINITY_DN1509_c0_g2_i1.p1  ORF type:complete len:673 (+),score=249.40 TRINITY_DN1509_c0_g2_i1:57-2075(+)